MGSRPKAWDRLARHSYLSLDQAVVVLAYQVVYQTHLAHPERRDHLYRSR